MNWLKKLCSERGLNLEQLSRKTGIIDQTLRRIEKTGGCRSHTLIKLKQALNLEWQALGDLIEKDFK